MFAAVHVISINTDLALSKYFTEYSNLNTLIAVSIDLNFVALKLEPQKYASTSFKS